jgi:hypothetical protein
LIEIFIQLVSCILLIFLAFHLGYGLWLLIEIPTRKWGESAFDYVYVDDDGSARELNAEEDEFVTTTLFPDDQAQFFIKPRYESLGPDGRLRGYLRRRQLPKNASVGPPPSDNEIGGHGSNKR